MVPAIVLLFLVLAVHTVTSEAKALPTKAYHREPFFLSGQPSKCSDIDINGVWDHQGVTGSARPWYQKTSKLSETGSYYMYFDPDVSGQGESFEQWVISTKRPSLHAKSNLAEDKFPLVLGAPGGSSIVAHTIESKYTGKRDAGRAVIPPNVVEWDLVCPNGGDMSFYKPIRARLGMSQRF
jgi:hypothetical protein